MYCKNCKNEVPDGFEVCAVCGAIFKEEIDQSSVEANAETSVIIPEEQPAFSQPVFEQPPKKNKKLLAWLIPVIAVVVAAAVAAVLLLGPMKGWWMKSFGSEEAYRDFVQENSTETATGTVAKAYGAVLSALSGENETTAGAADVSMKLNVGDKAIGLLEDLTKEELGEKLDMDWAKNIELKLSANVQEDLQQIGAALNISDKEIAVLDAILNLDEGKLFVAIVNLNDEYLEVDISEYLPTEAIAPAWMQMLEDPQLVKALPTEKEMDALLNKYIAIVMDHFDDVEKTTETVKVGELSQKLTVLDTKIDGEDVADALEAVLKAAREDKQIESIIRKAVGYLQSREEFKDAVDADEIYKEFVDAIDEALADMPDMDTEGDPIILSQYINGSHETVGYALTVEGEELARCVEIRDGSKLAYELKIADAVEVVGEGTEKKGAVTADFTVSVISQTEKMEVATVSLVDFKAEDDAVNGKIRIAPSADLLKQAGLTSTASSAIDLAKLQLELGFATAKNSGTVEINVLSGEDLLVGLAFTATEKKATDITEPTNTCDIEDVTEWLEDIDLDKLVKALDDAGLPASELIGNIAA